MLTTLNEPARMNLQLFGDAPEAAQQPEAAPQDESVVEFFNQLTEEPQDGPQGPVEAGAEPPVEPEPEPLIMGKFKTQEDLEQAYREAERRISQYGQQFSQNQQQMEQMQAQLQQFQQFMQRFQEPQQSPEEVQERNQKWLDKFYESPIEALSEVVLQNVQQVVAPLSQKIQYQENVNRYSQQVTEARQKYPDFDNFMPQMQEIIKEQGAYLSGLPNSVEVVYNMAKAQTIKSPDDYLKDEAFRQKLLQDETIRNEILKQYAQTVKDGQPPVVLSNQHGEPPLAEPMEIKSTQDAKKATLSFFQRMAGGIKQ